METTIIQIIGSNINKNIEITYKTLVHHIHYLSQGLIYY